MHDGQDKMTELLEGEEEEEMEEEEEEDKEQHWDEVYGVASVINLDQVSPCLQRERERGVLVWRVRLSLAIACSDSAWAGKSNT